jgi:hypothetical protein
LLRLGTFHSSARAALNPGANPSVPKNERHGACGLCGYAGGDDLAVARLNPGIAARKRPIRVKLFGQPP